MSVTDPQGFRAAGVCAGLAGDERPDVALVINDGPDHHAAAMFTGSPDQAGPVMWSRQVLADARVDAVVLSAGGSNADTGPEGFLDTHRTAEAAAAELDISAGDVVVASIGAVGERPPLEPLLAGITTAASGLSAGGTDAAAAISTGNRPLESVALSAGWSVGGMAGATLVVLTTDAQADPAALDSALRAGTAATFGGADSDWFQSTNDTVLLLSSGASGVRPSQEQLTEAVRTCCADLARQLTTAISEPHS